MKKLLLSCAVAVLTCVGANAQVIFEETFKNVTVGAEEILTSGLTDETGYVVGGGTANIMCLTDGILSLDGTTGSRFTTREMDLSGDNVYLYVTFKFRSPEVHKRFQIALNVTGTSNAGNVLNLYGDAKDENDVPTAPVEFETREFLLEGGTATSYLQFRGESEALVDISHIKITRGPDTSIGSTIADKDVVSVEYYNLLGKKVSANSNGFVIEKSTFTDGTTSSKKLFLTK